MKELKLKATLIQGYGIFGFGLNIEKAQAILNKEKPKNNTYEFFIYSTQMLDHQFEAIESFEEKINELTEQLLSGYYTDIYGKKYFFNRSIDSSQYSITWDWTEDVKEYIEELESDYYDYLAELED